MPQKKIRLRTGDNEGMAAYLELWAHPGDGSPLAIARTVDLHNLIPNYMGPRLALDLDKDGRPIGMEILYPWRDIEEKEDDEP